MYKWILGFIGLYIFRLPGFFIGLFIGHQIDKNNFVKIRNNIKRDFELNLLALASILIKADGKVTKQELEKIATLTSKEILFPLFLHQQLNKNLIQSLKHI